MRILLVLLAVLTSTTAAAENVGVVVTGEATMQPQLVSQLEGWLKQNGHELVPAPLPPDAVNTLIDCFVIEDEGCARSIIEKRSKSKAVVYARVDIQAGGDLEKTVTVLAYWFEKGRTAVAERRFCERCTDLALRTTADDLMAALANAGQKKAGGKLKVTSKPPGAKLVVDGKPIGFTPLTHTVEAGPHELTISHDGHETETRFVTVKVGAIETIEVPLVEGSNDGGKKQLLPLVTMGVGGALFVTGIVMFAIDQDEGRNEPEFIRNTAPSGIGIGIAGLAVAAGGYFWYRSATKRESAPVAAITHDGAYVGWLGRF